MTNAADQYPSCDPAPTAFRIKRLLAGLFARLPRRLDTVDPERMSRHMLRDLGLSD